MVRNALRAVVVVAAAAGLVAMILVASSPAAVDSSASRATPRLSEQRILRIAQRAAAAAGDPVPTLIRHSEGTRQQANLVASGATVPGQRWSYLIAEQGRFVLALAHVPPGAPAPRGSVLTLAVDAATGDVTDSGLASRFPSLATLGPVTTDLRRGVPTVLPGLNPPSHPDQAGNLVNQAREIAQATSPACSDRMVPRPRVTLSNAPPPAALLGVLGVLRRAQAPADRLSARQLRGLAMLPPAVLTIYRRYTRVIHEPGGVTAQIVVGEGQESLPESALYPCLHAATRVLLRLVVGQPSAVRAQALRLQHAYKLGPQTQGRHPWLDYMAFGGTGGAFDPRVFRAHGIAIEGCATVAPPGSPYAPRPVPPQGLKVECDLNGLVPDGVATMTLKLTGQTHYTPLFGRPSPYYRLHPYTKTIRVLDNAWAFEHLPADPVSAARQTIIWRDAHGRAVHIEHFQ